jgi:hypothetical protein
MRLRAIINSLKIVAMHFCLRLMVAAIGAIQMTSHVFAQDSLRIIELSAPGQSAPVAIPAGHVFTFSLFSTTNDPEDAVGVVTYTSPFTFTFESKYSSLFPYRYEGWYLGPAKVSLKGSLTSGARMQLYVRKLPGDVRSGILSPHGETHSAVIPRGHLLTPLLGFDVARITSFAALPSFLNILSIRTPSGNTYGFSRVRAADNWTWQVSAPLLRGAASLHNPNVLSSDVVPRLYFDDLDSVSPTADFVGPGTATFSLPPENERSTPIAFYCYRITPANVIGADASPPSVKVTAPAKASATTTSKSFLLKGSVTDNINPTIIKFRVRAPNASAYGSWESVRLAGDQRTKNWQRSISLPRKGDWRVQVQALDGENNASTIQTVTLTRR